MTRKYVGLSAYAAMSKNFPIDAWLRITERVRTNPAMAVSWNIFGKSTANMELFIKEFAGRWKLLEIQPSNEVGRGKDGGGMGQLLPGWSVEQYEAGVVADNPIVYAAIDNRFGEILDFVTAIDDGMTEFIVTDGLENKFKKQIACTKLISRIRHTWPNLIARCPYGHSNFKGGADIWEKHQTTARVSGGIVNEDGSEEVTLSQSKKFMEENPKAKARLLWRRKHQGSGLPRHKRKFVISKTDERDLGGLLSRY